MHARKHAPDCVLRSILCRAGVIPSILSLLSEKQDISQTHTKVRIAFDSMHHSHTVKSAHPLIAYSTLTHCSVHSFWLYTAHSHSGVSAAFDSNEQTDTL